MWPRSLETLPALDLSIPDLPPRSRLFAMPPAGLGTDHVEGLTSYLTRLARAHAVNPRRLLRDVFAKTCRSPIQLRCAARHVDDIGTMNGVGSYAAIFTLLTTELTTVSGIRHLTFLPLTNLLPRNGALTAWRRWSVFGMRSPDRWFGRSNCIESAIVIAYRW